MRNERYELGERRLDVFYERGTAGAGQEAFLDKFLRLGQGDHIRAERRLNYGEEAELFESRDDLTELCICKLAGDRGCDDRIYLGIFAALALFQEVDDVEDIGTVGDGAERALVHARTAGNALFVVDLCRLVFVHGDCFDLAGILTGTLAVGDRGKGADLRTLTALHALGFINVRHMVVVKGDRAALADVLTAVCKASATGIGDFIAGSRALVAGDLDDLDHMLTVIGASHGDLHALAEDRTLLVHATAHGRLLAGHDLLRNIERILQQSSVPCLARDFAQDLVFEVLYFGIKLSHGF